MVLEDKYKGPDKAAFLAKVQAVSDTLGIDPNWLMIMMYKESGLDPHIGNGIGAVGLIQFIPSTAKSLGTSSAALKAMSGTEQMDWVLKYMLPYRGRFKSFVDVYLCIFYPAAIGKGDMHVIARRGSRVYALNKGMDRNPENGKLSVLDVKHWLVQHLPADAAAYIAELQKKTLFG